MRQFDLFFGPDYTGVIRPTPEGQPQRPIEDALKLASWNPFPDVNVFLKAKGQQALIDWALGNLPEVACRRVLQFVKDKNTRHLLTLTESEIFRLKVKITELGVWSRDF